MGPGGESPAPEASRPGHSRLLRRVGTVIFLCIVVFFAYNLAPLIMDSLELSALRPFPPRTIPQLLAQRDALLAAASSHPLPILGSLCALYIAMQACAIPGTLSLSVLFGALYGAGWGLALVAVVSTLGALCCYALASAFARDIADGLAHKALALFRGQVAARQSSLLLYIMLLRVTPFLPNTFINLASPVVGVPVLPFLFGTLLGCLPNNYLAVNAGTRLSTITSFADLYDARMLGISAVACVGTLIPIILDRRRRRPKAE